MVPICVLFASLYQISEFVNRKAYLGTVLQGLVDHCGNVRPALMWGGLESSTMPMLFDTQAFFSAMRLELVPGAATDVHHVIPPVTLGDPTCSLLPWLMNPFPEHLERRKELFNLHPE